jgi:hypothetical protein
MLQLVNTTPFQATLMLLPDKDGVESLFALVKATFDLGPPLVPAGEQVPIAMMDEYSGEPGQSSIQVPTDVALTKPGTDVLLQGSAHSPGARPVTAMEVRLAAGSVMKRVAVFGDRVWRSGLVMEKPTDPEPFTSMPLVWEKAFGGTDLTSGEEPAVLAENRNPIGLGFRGKNGQKKLDGLQLPNLEDPAHILSSSRDAPPPAGFGPVCPHWEPRRTYAGTYDEAWQKTRAPYPPRDFDPRFFLLAPPDQVVTEHLKGGERVVIEGVDPDGPIQFELPRMNVEAAYDMDDGREIRTAPLDTVMILSEKKQVILMWKAVMATDKKSLRVREVEVTAGAV